MSDTIDRRVVEMRFDNQQFESRTRTTLGTLEKLKNALNFSHASDGLDKLNKSVGNMNLNPLRSAVDGVQVSFSKLEAMAMTALVNITNRAVDAGVSLAKNLTIDQLSAGWQKYADKTTAVQTIMAATKNQFTDTAEQMEFVNDQLDKLNWFTDETSYNFVDMVSNIGKFTSANVPLDDSVTAMEGIATWAAVSGQNATVASRAMYQLSQALGAGAVKLLDWRSIENANMNTYEFKETALETAVSLGILKKEADGVYKTVEDGTKITNEGFRDSLQLGWFTSDVLMKTLEQYGGFTDKIHEVSDATGLSATELLQLMDRYREAGDSASEMLSEVAKANKIDVEELQQYMEQLTDDVYELGEKAFRAGQEAKTFQEAVDSVKDAVSTGWMNTFEIIFGDYEEARVRWTALANELWDIFASGAEARNELLEEALGLPENIVAKQTTGWSAIQAAIEAAGIPLDEFIQRCLQLGGKGGQGITSIEEFKASLTSGWLTGDIVAKAIDSFIAPINNAGEVAESVGHTFEDFKRIIDETWLGGWDAGQARVEAYTEAGWDADAMQKAVNKSGEGLELTMEDYQAALGSLTDEQLKSAGYTEEQIEQLRALKEEYEDVDGAIREVSGSSIGLKTGSELLFDGISKSWNAIKGIFSAMKAGWDVAFPPMTADRLYEILEAFNAVANRFNDWVGNWDDSEGTPISKTVENIKNTFAGLGSVLGIGLDVLKGAAKFIKDTFASSVGSGIDKILEFTGSLGEVITSARAWIKENNLIGKGFDWVSDELIVVASGFKSWFERLKQLPTVQKWISKGSSVWNSFIQLISDSFPKAAEKAKVLFDVIRDIWENKDFSSATDAIKQFALALKQDLLGVWDELKRSSIFGRFVTGLESIWTAIKTLDASTLTSWAKSVWDGMKTFLQPALDFLSNIKDKLFEYADGINSGMMTIGDVIKDAAGYLKEHIGGIIAAFTLFITAKSIINFIRTIINIAKAVTAPVTTIVNSFNSFANAARGIKNAANALAVIEVVAAISALAWATVKLGEVPRTQLLTGLLAIITLGLVVGIIMALMAELNKSRSLLNPKQVASQAVGMLKIVELAGAIYLVAKAFETVLAAAKGKSWKEILAVVGGLTGAVVALGALSWAISKYGGTGGKGVTGPMIAIAADVYILSECFQDILTAISKEGVTDSDIKWALGVILSMTGTLGVIAVALAFVSKIPTQGSLFKTGGGIFAVALAVKMLVSAFSDIMSMTITWDKSKIGVIVGIIVAMGGIMVALSKMPASAGLNGIGLFGVSAAIEVLAIAIRTMASLDGGDIAKGIIAIGAMMTFLGIFTLLTRKGSELGGKSALVFLGMSVAILILSGAIAVLSLLKEEDVVIGTAAIVAMITAIGVMMGLSAMASDLKVSHFIGIVLVVAALTVAIVALSSLDESDVILGTLAISAMLTACGIMMMLSSVAGKLNLGTFVGLGLVILALAESIRMIASLESGVGKAVATMAVMMTMFAIMSRLLATASTSFKDAGPMGLVGIGICAAVVAGLALVVAALANMENVDAAIQIATAMGILMLGVGVAMDGVAAVGKVGWEGLGPGLVGLIAVIAIVAAVIAAIVALNEYVPGVQEALEKALPLFRDIGRAIGNVIGGLVEGFLGIDTTNLTQQLTNFGDGMKGFADSAGGISDQAVNGVKAIAAMLLALAGGDLLNAITGLLGGKITTLSEFSSQLPGFGQDLHNFADKLGTDFNGDAVSAAATAAKDLAKMANGLPTSGGWKAKILGDPQNLSDFGESINTFADDLKTFCEKISDDTIDPDKISTVASAASSLVDLINNLPAKDGWLQKIIGQPQDLETFGSGMVEFGKAIKKICGTGDEGIGDITEEDVACIGVAKTAADQLVELEDSLPDEEGWFGKIFGGKQDFEGFGDQIKKFGAALKTAVSADGFGGLGDTETGYVDTAVSIVNQLKGLVTEDFDNNKLSSLGQVIEDFGEYLYNFNIDASSINSENLSSIVTSINDLVASLSSAAAIDTTTLDSFTSSLGSLASSGISSFCQAFEDARPLVIVAVVDFLTAATNAIESMDSSFGDDGESSAKAYYTKFGAQKKMVEEAAESVTKTILSSLQSSEVEFGTKGEDAVKNYLKGFQNQTNFSKSTASNLASSILSALSTVSREFTAKGLDAASNYVNAIASYTKHAYEAGKNLLINATSPLSDSYSSAHSKGQDFGSGFVNGIRGWANKTYSAAYDVGRAAVKGLKKSIDSNSPSKESQASGDYFGVGFVSKILSWVSKAGTAANTLGGEAVTELNRAIAKVPDLISSELMFDPVIRPIVDLSNAQQSAAALNDMFNRSISMTTDTAAMTNSAVIMAKVRTSGAEQAVENGTSAVTTQPPTINNVFNIYSNDAEKVANIVSRRIQRQVERKESTWAQSSGTRSPLVRSPS